MHGHQSTILLLLIVGGGGGGEGEGLLEMKNHAKKNAKNHKTVINFVQTRKAE